MGRRLQSGGVPIHNLRPNDIVWTPPCVIFLDTETRARDDGDRQVLSIRLWVAERVDRRSQGGSGPAVVRGEGRTAEGLAERVHEWTTGRKTVWLYAHNLGFDLTTTRLPSLLVGLGWSVVDFGVRSTAPWVRLRRGSKVLTLVDSWSWLPERLESVATRMGATKRPLPDEDGPDSEWRSRCSADVRVLSRAVLGLMDWWDQERLGRWSITGAACGWNAMRHIRSQQRHVIDVTPDLVAQDRLAVRGGRRDAQVVDGDGFGPWVELDLVAAYPTVAAELPLPIKRAYTFDGLPLDTKWVSSRFAGAVADCLIECDRPRYPVRHDGVTWFPTGRFRTVLAAPEIAWARQCGDLVEIGPGQMHRLGWALQEWASWVLATMAGGDGSVPAVGRAAAKTWSRSVIGKFGARSAMSFEMPVCPDDGWRMLDGWDRTTGHRGALVDMAGSRRWVSYGADSENCYPAVLAFVESEVRVRLGRVLEWLGNAWWTCDTDGLILDLSAAASWVGVDGVSLRGRPKDALGVAESLCGQLSGLCDPLVLRPKRMIDSLQVLGPQQVTVDGVRRFSGLAREHQVGADGRLVSFDWPGLSWQMAHGSPEGYVRPLRRQRFGSPTVHRWVRSDGRAVPVMMDWTPEGGNRIVSWSESWAARSDVGLADEQYRRLRTLT